MQHEMHGQMAAETAKASGTLLGHLGPGLLFSFWGVWWVVHYLRTDRTVAGGDPLEGTSVLPTILKLLVLPVAGWIEMPGPGWERMDAVMGWTHIAMYAGFTFSGLVDLLHRWGRLSYRATYFAFAGANANAALLFALHGNHGGVETLVHQMIAGAFALAALGAAIEGTFLWPRAHWVRCGAILTVGGWFLAAGWLLYLSGWDLVDPIRVLWVPPIFSGIVLGIALVLILILSGIRRTPTP